MNRLFGLEGIRGYLALWVWVTHATTMATLPFEKNRGWGWLLANGDTAVGVFIVISGFVIALNVDRSYDGFGRYIVRRAFRLFPVYLVCLLASVLILDYSIELLQNMPWQGGRTGDRVRYLLDSKEHFWIHLGLHVFLLHGVVPNALLNSTSYAFMGQAWSLTLEWQFYLVAPFLFAVANRFKLSMTYVVPAFVALLGLPTFFGQDSFLLGKLYLFFVGYVSYRIYKEFLSGDIDRKRALLLFSILALVSLVRWKQGFGALGWCCAFVMLYFVSGRAHGVVKWFFTNRLATWLGDLSYAFYCVHMIVLFLCAGLILHVLKVESQNWYAVWMIAASLPISLGASWLLHRLVENPMISAGKTIAYRRTLPVAG